MKIVNFGSCNIDYVYQLDHIVKVGETEHSSQRDVFPGGKGLNQSIAVAKAGAKVYHAGCIGSDGALLLDTMTDCGVDVSFVQRVNEPSGHAVIQVSNQGENSIFIHSGANGMFTKEYIDSVLMNFGKGDLLLLQNEINNISYIVESAHQRGMLTVINPSPIDDNIEKIDFNMISYAVLNEIEGEYLSGCKEPAKIVSALRKKHPELKVVLTLGDKGCMYHDGKELYFHSAYDVPVVDSTAAGDTFLGYFVASLAEGLEPAAMLERACIASGLAVAGKGAAPSIPYGEDVKAAYGFLHPKDSGFVAGEGVQQKIDNYILKNIQTATLSELAAQLGYSSVYTGHIVKKVTGRSFAKYIQEKRCSIAAKLLRETELPISQIIHQIGYNNESFFRNKFKELYGVSPLSYRKTLKNQGGKKP
ncbi:MAG: helix-turn-helix domain-containing protein [Ruminococcaceae bacterium]|nr:helix-turn-helix domain-containing protein [Oscillospiraceae bacterium]